MKRWFKYIKPYLGYFIFGPVCMIVEVIGEVIMPKLLASVINAANDGTLTNESSIGTMFLMILTAVIMMAGGVGGAYFASKASVYFAADLRADMYSRVQAFSFANIDKFSTGSLVTRLTNDVTQVQNFIAMLLRMALRAPGMMIAALVMAILIKPSLSVVFAVSIPLMLLTLVFIVRTGFMRFSRMQEKIDALNSNVQENVTNVRVVKSFVREEYSGEGFRKANKELKDSGIRAMSVMIFLGPIMTLFMNATIIAVILIGGRIVLRGGMSVGDLSAFITYVTQILSSLLMITFLIMISSRAMASGKRINEVMDEKLDVTDENAACPDKKVENGEIEFRNVSFRYYKDSEDEVLSDINLKIPANSIVGIIGSTGSGKTTLVSMIPRLYDCDKGEVLVDGVNVRDYSLVNLRDGIGMVLQKNTLFSGEGYDTQLDQGGTNVSGGQKQRLCIARALLKKPKILILDDSTSAVDTATEAQIRRAFREELQGATKIIIAQRISSVRDADMIVVVNEGRITGIGKHDELLRDNLEYREIYESQSGKEE